MKWFLDWAEQLLLPNYDEIMKELNFNEDSLDFKVTENGIKLDTKSLFGNKAVKEQVEAVRKIFERT